MIHLKILSAALDLREVLSQWESGLCLSSGKSFRSYVCVVLDEDEMGNHENKLGLGECSDIPNHHKQRTAPGTQVGQSGLSNF